MALKAVSRLSTNELWKRWFSASEDWAQEPGNRYRKAKMDRLEDEICRRIHGAAKQSLVRQEA